MKNFSLFFILLAAVTVSAQNAFWSNNGLVSIKDGAYLSVQGDAYNQNQGVYNNTDSIFVTGNWTHDASNRCFDSIGTGWVYLYAADQRIKGSKETHFHNLVLKGQGVKYGDLDVYIDGTLSLNDREFSMDKNTAWVLNPSPVTGVTRSSGFVSSLEDGGLLRRTNSTDAYLYPVGSNSGTPRYRPVEFKPLGTSENHYKARFANIDPTVEGFDRNTRFHLVCEINPNWYHRLYHITGSDSADITIMYDNSDGTWDDIAHWQVVPEWQSIARDTNISGTPFNRISKFRWDNYVYPPFALANSSKPFAVAGVDTLIWRYDTIQLNAFGGTNYTWTPDFNLSCINCPDPYAWPDSNITYNLVVENGKGCTDYDSLRVMVRDKPFFKFFIPNAITPNSDGYNDYWYIRDLERYPDNEVRIINRWGDEVFFEAPYGNKWDGTWKGEELPGATYYYLMKIKFKGEVQEFNGPLTVVR